MKLNYRNVPISKQILCYTYIENVFAVPSPQIIIADNNSNVRYAARNRLARENKYLSYKDLELTF